MAFIVFHHIKKTIFDPVRELSLTGTAFNVNLAPVRRGPRPIRRAGIPSSSIVVPATIETSRGRINSLQDALPSGIELNLSRQSDSIALDIQPDPADYWRVEEETRYIWGQA